MPYAMRRTREMKHLRSIFQSLAPQDAAALIAAGRAFRGPDGTVYPVIGGGADTTEAVEELLTRITGDGEGQGLGSLSAEELVEADEVLRAEVARIAEEEDSDEALERMEALAGHVESVREEAANREEAATERATRREGLLNRVNGEEGDGEAEGDEGETTGDEGETSDAGDAGESDGDGEAEGTGDGSGDEGSGDGEGDGEADGEQPQAQAASARVARPPLRSVAAGRPASQAPRTPDREQATMVASADIPGVPAGHELDGITAAADAFIRRHRAFSGKANSYEQVPVVTLHSEYPEDRVLTSNAERNMELIDAVVSPEALAAAGGFCVPIAPRYDLEFISTAARPVRDSLPDFQATQGGIRFMNSPVLGAFADAIGIWTEANDIAAVDDENVRKACLRVECDEDTTVIIDAITACLTFGNLNARTNPEGVANALRNVAALQARIAERKLLTRIGVNSTDVDASAFGLGAARHILHVFDLAAAGIRNRHRTVENMPFRAYLPAWARNLVRSDLAAEAPGSTAERLAVADREIAAFFSARNINVTYTLEGETGQDFGTQADGALADFPEEVIAYLFPEGSHLFLDGGELDLGIVRDSTLNARNDYQIFSETFEQTAFVGLESLRLTIPACPNGTTSAAVAYDADCGAS